MTKFIITGTDLENKGFKTGQADSETSWDFRRLLRNYISQWGGYVMNDWGKEPMKWLLSALVMFTIQTSIAKVVKFTLDNLQPPKGFHIVLNFKAAPFM